MRYHVERKPLLLLNAIPFKEFISKSIKIWSNKAPKLNFLDYFIKLAFIKKLSLGSYPKVEQIII